MGPGGRRRTLMRRRRDRAYGGNRRSQETDRPTRQDGVSLRHRHSILLRQHPVEWLGCARGTQPLHVTVPYRVGRNRDHLVAELLEGAA